MISYRTPHRSRINGRTEPFDRVLIDTKAKMEESGLQIFGESFADIVTDQALFETYRDSILEETDPNDLEDIQRLLDNGRHMIVQESLSAGLDPYSSYIPPVIRKLWPKVAIKEAIMTEVVAQPEFTVSFMRPYILGADGAKTYLPEGIDGDGEDLKLRSLYTGVIKLADFTPDDVEVTGASGGFDLFATLPTGVAASRDVGDAVDRNFRIVSIEITTLADDGETTDDQLVENLNIRPTIDGHFYYAIGPINYKHGTEDEETDNPVSDVLMGYIDYETATLTLSSTQGKITGVKIEGYVRSDSHSGAKTILFDIAHEDISIGTAPHVSCPLPTELVQDAAAMYNIDVAANAIELQTKTLAQQTENDGRNFVQNAFAVSNPQYTPSFDCEPAANFSGSPVEWLEGLKRVIDHNASKLIQDNNWESGTIVILGNPLDCNLIANVKWMMSDESILERSGVRINFNVGYFQGANRYKVVSAKSIPQGAMYILYTSPEESEITYRYYAYSFKVMKDGYSDANSPLVPAISATKRHTFKNFRDGIAKLTISSNTGAVTF